MESSHPKLTEYSDQYVPVAISSNFLLRWASNISLDYSQLEQKMLLYGDKNTIDHLPLNQNLCI
jgi:uncharacterized SAM-dependent methyltransferase